jgi:hypothetical protein
MARSITINDRDGGRLARVITTNHMVIIIIIIIATTTPNIIIIIIIIIIFGDARQQSPPQSTATGRRCNVVISPNFSTPHLQNSAFYNEHVRKTFDDAVGARLQAINCVGQPTMLQRREARVFTL